MNMLDIFLQLQDLRPGVPVYVLFDDIRPLAYKQIVQNLQAVQPGEEVDIILHSSGGYPDDAYRMIRAFRRKYKIVNVIIPLWAKSAATLFSFGANRIVLHELGELGPIDAQIRKDDEKSPDGEWSSALNVSASVAQIEKRSREEVLSMFEKIRSTDDSEMIKIGRRQLAEILFDYSAKFYTPLLQKIDPLEMGQMARTLDIGRMYARRILKQYTNTPDEKVNELLYFLVYECPDHGYVVDYEMIRTYLDFAIRTTDEPFSDKYDGKLGELSFALMSPSAPTLNAFVSSLAVKKATGNINPNQSTHDISNHQSEDSSTAESDTGGSEHEDRSAVGGADTGTSADSEEAGGEVSSTGGSGSGPGKNKGEESTTTRSELPQKPK